MILFVLQNYIIYHELFANTVNSISLHHRVCFSNIKIKLFYLIFVLYKSELCYMLNGKLVI